VRAGLLVRPYVGVPEIDATVEDAITIAAKRFPRYWDAMREKKVPVVMLDPPRSPHLPPSGVDEVALRNEGRRAHLRSFLQPAIERGGAHAFHARATESLMDAVSWYYYRLPAWRQEVFMGRIAPARDLEAYAAIVDLLFERHLGVRTMDQLERHYGMNIPIVPGPLDDRYCDQRYLEIEQMVCPGAPFGTFERLAMSCESMERPS
jgi:hypothetical protein